MTRNITFYQERMLKLDAWFKYDLHYNLLHLTFVLKENKLSGKNSFPGPGIKNISPKCKLEKKSRVKS